MDAELVKYDRRKRDTRLKVKRAKKPLPARKKTSVGLSIDELEIVAAALEAKDEWLQAGVNFNYATDELLVDYYIYKLKACESRYTYFLKLAKEKGLSNLL